MGKKNNKKSSVLFEQCSNSIGYWFEINQSNNMGAGRRLFKKIWIENSTGSKFQKRGVVLFI